MNNKEALRSGVWYTISTFILKGTSFLTAPVFARLLSSQEYGDFNVFATWMSILFIITSCDFQTSVIRSKQDLKDKVEGYTSSVLVLSSLITLFTYLVCLLFKDYIFTKIFLIDLKYIHFIFAYLLLSEGWQIYASKCRAFYKYRIVTILTFVSSFSSIILSLVLVCISRDKLTGRILGQYIPEMALGIMFYVIILSKGKTIKLLYWKNALKMCVPLVPHLLSLSLLSSSDKVILKSLCGAEIVAVYSIAVMCAHILSLLLDAMNKAWAPWFMDALHCGENKSIKRISSMYFTVFFLLVCFVIIVAPEIVYILGGEKYISAVEYIPPLIIGCLFQFAYSLYVQCEIYEKRTMGVAIGTISATAINIVLNYLLIPIFGSVAAAYTTLLGYMFLFFFHYLLTKRIGYTLLFDRRIIFGGLLFGVGILVFSYILYYLFWLRVAIIIGAIVFVSILVKTNINIIRKIIREFVK